MKRIFRYLLDKSMRNRVITLFLVLLALTLPVFSNVLTFSDSLLRGVHREVLPSGLTVITQTNNGAPIVSINVFVNTGSINEKEKNAGISHFCEHMFFRGTERMDNVEMKTAIENLGGTFNAETSKDMTRFYVNIPSEYGIEALKIYLDALIHAKYDNDQVEKERKVVLEEFNMLQESPMSNLHNTIYSLAFEKHPYRIATIGTEESIKKMSRDDLYAYKSKWYSPENIVVVIIGNFNRDEYVKAVKEQFAGHPNRQPKAFTTYEAEPLSETIKKIDTKPFDGREAYYVKAYRSPGIKDVHDVVAMDVLLFLMGYGRGSLLEKEISRKHNWVRNVSVDFLTSKDPGLVLFSARVNPDKIDDLTIEITSLNNRIKNGDFSEEEMNRARNMLVRTYIYGLETNEGVAQNLGFYELLGGIEFAEKYAERIKSVTKEDLMKVAEKYFGEHYVLYAIKPEGRRD
jgi:zinc protease